MSRAGGALLFAGLLCAGPAHASISLVHSACGSANTQATSVSTSAINLGAGHLLVTMAMGDPEGSTQNPSVTLASGDSSTSTVNYVFRTTYGQLWVFYAKNTTANASNTATMNFSGSGVFYPAVCEFEYSGVDTSAPLDVTATGSASSASSVTSGNLVTGAASEVIICAGTTEAGGTTPAAGSGFTIEQTQQGGAGGNNLYLTEEDKVLSATGTYTGSVSWNSSGYLGIGCATFKAASSSTNYPVAVAELMGPSGIAARLLGAQRPAADASLSPESGGRLLGYGRGPSDMATRFLGPSGDLGPGSRLVSYGRAGSDQPSQALDSSYQQFGKSRTGVDSLATGRSEIASRLSAYGRSPADATAATGEDPARLASYGRAVGDEAPASSDLAAHSFGASRGSSEQAAIPADLASRTLSYLRSLADLPAVSEIPAAVFHHSGNFYVEPRLNGPAPAPALGGQAPGANMGGKTQ